jgi:hypothetical protein
LSWYVNIFGKFLVAVPVLLVLVLVWRLRKLGKFLLSILVLLLLALGWYVGIFDKLLPDGMRRKHPVENRPSSIAEPVPATASQPETPTVSNAAPAAPAK